MRIEYPKRAVLILLPVLDKLKKGEEMRVTNLTSNKSNREVPNQFELRDDYGNVFFQSYRSIIVKIDNTGKTFLDEKYWDYSKTTGKYRNQFLGEKKNETEAKIKSGEYTLCNLN